MGCGPGPGRGIPLSEYQEEVGDTVMTVSGDDYTFVANHTIPADVEIIFGATDTLTINAGVDVILEGKLYVIDETDGFTRITVNGTFTMEEGSEIEICGNIINQGIGIIVNQEGTFTQNGGDIRITNVDGGGSDGIRVNDVGSNFTLNGGSIQISSVTNQGQGIDIIGTFNQNGLTSSITITNVNFSEAIHISGLNSQFNATAGAINIGSVLNGSQGINVRNAGQFNQSGTNITITNVTRSNGIILTNPATYTQNGGNINITNVDAAGFSSNGIQVNSQFNTTAGAINIGSVLNGAQGINVINAGQFNQSGKKINITNVDGVGSDGIRVNDAGSNFTISGGSIEIDTVTNQGQGIDIINEGTFNQNGLGTSITITNVNNAFGIEVTGVNSQFTTSAGTINIGSISIGGVGINVINAGQFNQNGLAISITFGQLTTNATAIKISSDSTFTKDNGPTISITNAATGGGTSGMVVTGTITGPVVTNLGPNSSIDMTNSDIPYNPLIDPFGNPWNGAGSSRAFYDP